MIDGLGLAFLRSRFILFVSDDQQRFIGLESAQPRG